MFKTKTLKSTTMALALTGVLAFSSAPSYAILGDQVLKAGMEHEDVKVLQQELKSLGLFNNDEETTKYFGNMTEQGVRAFQISQGIEINGIFDLNTYETLKIFKDSILTPEAVVDVVEISPEVAVASSNLLSFQREIGLEDKGDDVIQLQESLKALGYLDIENCTDYFGKMTKEALIAFQTEQGLKPDGIAGLRSIDSLNQVLKGRGISLPEPNRGSERSTIGTDIVATAKKYLGARYVYGGSSPSGFDCSGFTSYVYKQFGIKIDRTSVGQASNGTKVSKDSLVPGDLLIFGNTYKSGVSHTGLYLGNGQFIHASTSTTGVIISDLNSSYYVKKFLYGRRVF